MKKRILIIYTGGTLGMRPTERGYAPAGDLESLIRERLAELHSGAMPDYVMAEYDDPLESSNAAPRHWFELADRIKERVEDFDGFVVIHGTDTLAYTASALSFLLVGIEKPVVVTGSQIPLCEVRTDAQGNLVSSLQAAAMDSLQEVAVCFGRHIYRGNRTTKVAAGELDAFDSPNYAPLAELGVDIKMARPAALPKVLEHLETSPVYRPCDIAVLRIYPGMPARLIDAVAETGAKGLVLRCYGAGTAPTSDRAFLSAVRRVNEAGILLVAVSQCLQGSVTLGRYAAGSELGDAGAISGSDMTTEAAVAKLHVLFSMGLSVSEIASLTQCNLRGELTEP